jgi:UPF0758 protein swol_1642
MSEYKTVYEHFGCSSKEELFRELELESPKVQELMDLYQLVNEKANITLDGKEVVDNFIREHNLYPPNDTNIVLLLDAKLHLTDVAVFKTEKEYIDICSRPWGTRNIIIANDNVLSAKLAGKVEHLNPVDDRIAVKYDNILNKMTIQHTPSGEWTYIFTDLTGNPINPRFKTENEIREIVNTLSYQHKNIRNLIGADETVKDFFLEKLRCEHLNVYRDEEKIKEYLQKAYRHMGNEYFFAIGIDRKGNVSEVNEISVGSTSVSTYDARSIIRTLNKNDFVILGHNHPSGDTTPSLDDKKTMNFLLEINKHTQGKIIDNYIIGDNVFKFSESEYGTFINPKEIIHTDTYKKTNKKTIYEYFGCSSEDELFKKLSTRKSSKTRAVLDVYDAAKPIDSIIHSERCIDFIMSHALYPKGDTNVVMLLNENQELTDVATFKTEGELLEICSRPWGMCNIIISEDEKIANKMKSVIERFHWTCDTVICKYDLENKIMNIKPDFYGAPFQVKISKEKVEYCFDSLEKHVDAISNIRNEKSLEGADEAVKECYLHKLKAETLNIHKDKEKIKDYLLKGYKHMGNEHSLVIGIDKKGNISEVNEISVGSGSTAPVDCRAVVRTLNRNHFVILAHNHPSGSLTPSKDDINLTRNIMELANHTKGKVYDHYIIGNQVNEFSNDRSVSDDMKNKMKNYHMLQKSRGR